MTVPFDALFVSHWSSFLIWVILVISFLALFRRIRLLQKPFLLIGLKPGRLIPLLDTVGFLILVIVLANSFFVAESTARFVFTLLIAAVIFWSLKSVLKDWITGGILRLENGFQVGDRIEIKEGAGIVTKVGLRSLAITLDTGNYIILPYGSLSSAILQKPVSDSTLKTGVVELTIRKDSAMHVLEKRLRQSILTTPWTIVTEKPIIQPCEETGDQIRFRITVSVLDQTHLTELEFALRQQFEMS